MFSLFRWVPWFVLILSVAVACGDDSGQPINPDARVTPAVDGHPDQTTVDIASRDQLSLDSKLDARRDSTTPATPFPFGEIVSGGGVSLGGVYVLQSEIGHYVETKELKGGSFVLQWNTAIQP
jgi:hypothetical protein